MAKEFLSTSFLLAAATWSQRTTAPAGADGTGIGSIALCGGASALASEIYLKTATATYTKQNLVNINTFNVQAYGAKGDGVTNDTIAIQAAVAAAVAAGGGEVYFPATANFYPISKQGTTKPIISLSNAHNIAFVGDGFASKIRQVGSAGASDSWMFFVTNGASQISFADLYFDNFAITNPDPAQQNHCIQLTGASGDANVGPSDINITRCYFGTFIGDAVRFLGELGHFVDNVLVERCCFDTENSRVAVSAQRCERKIRIVSNWFETDQPIHFEPTGGTGAGGAGPEEWSIVGNHMTPRAGGTINGNALSGPGVLNKAIQNRFSYNTINLGYVTGLEVANMDFIGNIIHYDLPNGTAPSSSNSPCYWQQEVNSSTFSGNVISNLFAGNQGSGFKFFLDNGLAPFGCVVTDNVIRYEGDGTNGPIALTDCVRFVVSGNLLFVNSSGAGGFGIAYAATAFNASDILCTGNAIIATGGFALTAGVSFQASAAGPPPALVANMVANANFMSGLMTNGVLVAKGLGAFPAPCAAIGNMGVGFTGQMLSPIFGVTTEGQASSFGEQFVAIQAASGPNANASAPVGSLCTNGLGATYTALSYKESGTGSSGWLGTPASELASGAQSTTAATTAVFFAPGGMALPNAVAAEIQWVAPRAGRIRNFRGRMIAGTGGGNGTFRVRKNGVNSSISFLIANTSIQGSDLINSFVVAAGDLISTNVTKASAPTTPQTQVQLVLEYV